MTGEEFQVRGSHGGLCVWGGGMWCTCVWAGHACLPSESPAQPCSAPPPPRPTPRGCRSGLRVRAPQTCGLHAYFQEQQELRRSCLRRLHMFDGLSDSKLDDVAACFRPGNAEPGSVLQLQGTLPTHMLVLTKGVAKVCGVCTHACALLCRLPPAGVRASCVRPLARSDSCVCGLGTRRFTARACCLPARLPACLPAHHCCYLLR
jgi:hypothetical protein